MKKIYIYGCGGHGKVVADIAKACGYDETVFLDDNGKNKFNENLFKHDIIIAVGDNKIRKNLQNKVLKLGFNVVNLIHPSAIISESAKFGTGIVVMPNVVVNSGAIVKDGVILNTACVIEHECKIDEFVHISPKAALAGCVSVGSFSHMGIGSCAVQCVKIGINTVIGAGGVVISDIKSNVVAVGVPARVIKQNKI